MTDNATSTLETLTNLEALMNAATPGPWQEVAESGEWWITGPSIESDFVINSDYDTIKQADADFIVAARNALPAIIAEFKKLQADVYRWSNEAMKTELQRVNYRDAMFDEQSKNLRLEALIENMKADMAKMGDVMLGLNSRIGAAQDERDAAKVELAKAQNTIADYIRRENEAADDERYNNMFRAELP